MWVTNIISCRRSEWHITYADVSTKESISPTFYEQFFCTKVIWATILYLEFVLVFAQPHRLKNGLLFHQHLRLNFTAYVLGYNFSSSIMTNAVLKLNVQRLDFACQKCWWNWPLKRVPHMQIHFYFYWRRMSPLLGQILWVVGTSRLTKLVAAEPAQS